MKNLNTCFLVAAGLMLFSCKKESIDTQLKPSVENASMSASKEVKWQGEFISYNGLPGSRSIPAKLFIKNGYARIYTDSAKINRRNYYSTTFRLVIPDFLNIKSDSLNFEVGVKNPFNSSFYSPYFGRDITLYLKGETNEAFINNVATGDINPDGHTRAAIGIGQRIQNNMSGLQHNFEDYDTLIMQTFNRGVKSYRNDEILEGLGYGEQPIIGRLKEIGIIFKGSGFVDYIKIYNSVNGRLLMSEDFNTDGQSTIIIWY